MIMSGMSLKTEPDRRSFRQQALSLKEPNDALRDHTGRIASARSRHSSLIIKSPVQSFLVKRVMWDRVPY